MRNLARFSSMLGLAAAVVLPPLGAALAAQDWTTYAFDNQRTGYNPGETTLDTKNVGQLKRQWSTGLGGPSITQPLVATGVATAHGTRDLVYVGTQSGALLALDRRTGAVAWRKQLGAVAPCSTDHFGVNGTPVLDRGRHRLFATDGRNQLHALDEATGGELAGWPVTVADPNTDHVWAGMTEAGGSLYVATAGSCEDRGLYRGRVVRVDIAAHKVAGTWFVNGADGPFGGGIWGSGGLSVEADGSALYAATGNSKGKPQSGGYSEHVVKLTPGLAVVAANYPGLKGPDVDFGATPTLYRPSASCPAELAVMNKTGALLVYDRASVGKGPRQRIQIGDARLGDYGDFIMNPAYDPNLHLLYVNATTASSAGTYKSGVIALKTTGCSLAPAWHHDLPGGSSVTDYPSVTPTLANGVAYVIRSNDSVAYAFDAATGAQLWSSGGQIAGGIFAAATVANGQVLVSSYGGRLYAFGL